EAGRSQLADLADIAIPSHAKVAAQALGLEVHHRVTCGARVRQIPCDEAEIAVECLHDWGLSARVLESTRRGEPPTRARRDHGGSAKSLSSRAGTSLFFQRVHVGWRSGGQSVFFRGCPPLSSHRPIARAGPPPPQPATAPIVSARHARSSN